MVDIELTEKTLSDLMKSVSVYDDQAIKCTVNMIVSQINQSLLSLLDLVKLLQPFLINVETNQRKIGIKILSLTISRMPRKVITQDELHFLAEFYADRLKDHHSIYPEMIQGIAGLVKQEQLKVEDLVALLRCFFNEIQTQSQLVNDRYRVFRMFSNLVFYRMEDVICGAFGLEFVLGFIQSVQGEKDPRNLLLIFSCWPCILQNTSGLSSFIEDCFDCISCYFPIDFNSSSIDCDVTRENLIKSLRPCLFAHPDFASFLFPLLMEKLDSDLHFAKVDSLATLRDCVVVFGRISAVRLIGPHLQLLWNSLKSCILSIRMQSYEKAREINDSALQAIRSITLALPNDCEDELLDSWLKMIIKECVVHLGETSSKLMPLSIEILSSVAKGYIPVTGGLQIGQIIVKSVLPTILKSQNSDPYIVYKSLATLFSACLVDIYDVMGEVDAESLIRSCLKVDGSSLSLFIVSNMCLCSILTHVGGRWDITIKDRVLMILSLTSSFDATLASVASDLAKLIIFSSPEPLLGSIFERLRSDDIDENEYKMSLVLLVNLCHCHQALEAEKIISFLLEWISKDDVPVIGELINSFENLWKSEYVDCRKILIRKNILHIIIFLIKEEKDSNVVNNICKLISLMMQSWPLEEAFRINDACRQILIAYQGNMPNTFKCLEAILGQLNEEILTFISDEIIKDIFSIEPDDNSIGNLAVCRGVLLNKLTEAQLGSIPDKLRETFSSAPLEDVVKDEVANRYALLLVWTIKGLLWRRTEKDDSEFWHRILEQRLLHRGALANQINLNFCIIIKPHVFFPEHIVPFFRQKFFVKSLPYLLVGGTTALIGQLEYLPACVLVLHMAKLLPIIVSGLSLNQNSDIVGSTLATLYNVMQFNPDAFVDQLATFIPLWINIASSFSKLSTVCAHMNDRILALKCLGLVVRKNMMETHDLVRVQPVVVHGLRCVLDDHKRLVRKEATNTRNQWCLAA